MPMRKGEPIPSFCPYCAREFNTKTMHNHVRMKHAREFGIDGYAKVIDKYGRAAILEKPGGIIPPEPKKEEKQKIMETMPKKEIETLVVEPEPIKPVETKKYKHKNCGAEFDELTDGKNCPGCGDELV